MPYVLSRIISPGNPGFWREGAAYSVETIYDIKSGNPAFPPVHYLSHTLKPHSLCHVDAPAHTIPGGATIGDFFNKGNLGPFFGECVLVSMQGRKWKPTLGIADHFEWRVSRDELIEAVRRVTGSEKPPSKLLLTAEGVPPSTSHGHAENYALVLSQEAADWVVSGANFSAYGTSWKSTDFQPGSRERPIHQTLFKKGLVFECLELMNVPEGVYFWSAFPLPLAEASEAPVCPVLFGKNELGLAVNR